MSRWLGRLIAFGLFVGGLAFVVLTIVASLAGTRGVREVPPRRSALLDSVPGDASYRDAYEVPIPIGSFSRIEDLADAAFRKGVQVGRAEREVLYRGRFYGLRLYTDYAVVQSRRGPAIVVTSVFHLMSSADRVRFALLRPVHRRLMPFLVGRIASSAVADTEPDA